MTSFAYDALDRVTTISRSLGGVAGPEVTLGYDALDRLTGMTRTAGVGTAAIVSSFAYDALDRLTSLTHDKLGGATLASFAYDYDLAGRVTGEVDARGAATYTYDGLGQLTAVDRPGTEADESYGYDAAGNRTGAGYATGLGNRLESAPGFSYTYDDEGNRVSQTELATGRVTTYAYDHRNRMTGATVKDAAGRLTGATTYRYDALDRRIGTEVLRGPTYVSDLPFSATQRVDGVPNPPPVRRDTSTNPAEPLRLDGTTYLKGLGASGESTILVELDGQYDRFRAVVGIDDEARPGGRVAFRVYDARPGGDVLLYDSGELWGGASGAIAQPIDISVAGVETLKLYVDPRGSTNYDWANWADAHLVPLGEVTYLSDLPFSSVQDGGGGGGFNVPVQIDAHAGALGGDPADFPLRLDGTTYLKGLGAVGQSEILVELDGRYERFRAVVGIEDDARPGGHVAFRVYDARSTGDVLLFDSGELWGTGTARGLDVGVAGVETLKLVVDPLGDFAYDWANWADAHLVPLGEVAYLSDLPFTATQVLDGGATPPVRRDTSADPTKPLKLDGTTYLKGLGAHAHSTITLDLDGQYDRFRAVLGVDDQVPGTGLVVFRVYDARSTGDVLLYDSGPRQKGDPALPLDLVVAGIASLKLVVDPQGVTDYDWADWADAHLIPKSDLGLNRAVPERTWTAYDGVNPYARFDGAGDLTTRLLHGPAVDWLLARSDAQGATDWYLTDRLGSVRALADAQGAVINRLDYDAYGHPTHESNPAAGDVFGFTGRERDAVTGLQYNRHRYYDAAIGGWTQPDPIGFAGGDANLYRYVGNSPTNFVDPDGLRGTPARGGYRGGGFNPLNWPRWIYTGDPNTPDEYYDAAWEGLGQGYTQAYNDVAPQASSVLAGGSFAPGPAGWFASGANVALATILNPSIEPHDGPLLAAATPRGRPVVIIQRPGPLADRVAARANARRAESCPTPVPRETATRLAQQGEDLFVGTYSQARRGNLQSGLNQTHTPHHSVQNAVSSTSHGTGVTINLRKDLHALTRTYRKPVEQGLSPRQHLGRDVADIKKILTCAGYDRRTINAQLQELIRQNKAVGGFGK